MILYRKYDTPTDETLQDLEDMGAGLERPTYSGAGPWVTTPVTCPALRKLTPTRRTADRGRFDRREHRSNGVSRD
jgi:hypothetical protein